MINNSRWLGLAAVAALLAGGCRTRHIEAERYLQGTVELDERVLGFEVAGRVKTRPVHRGESIRPGQVLATLDDEVAKTELDARSADAAAAEAQKRLVEAGNRPAQIRATEARVRAAKANEDMLRQSLGREEKLLERGASTKAAVDDLAAQVRAALANRQAVEQELAALREGARPQEIESAHARAEAAKKTEALGKERLERFELRSPVDGVVLDTHVDPGVVVGAGAPVVTVADTTHPYVDVFVPVAQLGAVHDGSKATVRVDAIAKTYAAHVEWIARTTEFTPRFLFSPRERPNLVVRVRVQIDDPDEAIHAGVPAFATVDGVEVKL